MIANGADADADEIRSPQHGVDAHVEQRQVAELARSLQTCPDELQRIAIEGSHLTPRHDVKIGVFHYRKPACLNDFDNSWSAESRESPICGRCQLSFSPFSKGKLIKFPTGSRSEADSILTRLPEGGEPAGRAAEEGSRSPS
jgi:hypothetical protein